MIDDERKLLAFSLTRFAEWVKAGAVTDDEIIRRLRSAAAWVEGTSEKKATMAADVKAVFEHWQRATGRPKTILTEDRRAKIKARLRRRPVEALCAVIDWATRDEHMGKYDTIATLFRSDGKVEDYLDRAGWLERAPKEGVSLSPSSPSQPVQSTIPIEEVERCPLNEFLAENPELEEKARRLKGILGFVDSDEPPSLEVERGPESIAEIIGGEV